MPFRVANSTPASRVARSTVSRLKGMTLLTCPPTKKRPDKQNVYRTSSLPCTFAQIQYGNGHQVDSRPSGVLVTKFHHNIPINTRRVYSWCSTRAVYIVSSCRTITILSCKKPRCGPLLLYQTITAVVKSLGDIPFPIVADRLPHRSEHLNIFDA